MFDEQAAGFFAAEGHFHLKGDVTRKKKVYRQTQLYVGQKEKYWPALLKERYGLGGLYLRRNGKASFVPGSLCWCWVVSAEAAEALYAHFLSPVTTWHWVVGFWEGDGSIEENNVNPATPTVKFCNSVRGWLEPIQTFLGTGSIYSGVNRRGNPKHVLAIYGEDARELTLGLYREVISPKRKAQLGPYVKAVRSRNRT